MHTLAVVCRLSCSVGCGTFVPFPGELELGSPALEDRFFTTRPHSSDGKESVCSVGDLGSIPGSGRSPGEANGNPLQYSCLKNPMDIGAWGTTVHGVARVGHNLATKPPRPDHQGNPCLHYLSHPVCGILF